MRQLAIAAVLAIVATACRGGDIVNGVSDSTFVRTMIALRQLPIGISVDTGARARSRDSILRAHDITAAELEAAAARLADQPDRAAQLWRVIESAPASPPAK
jgi:hypothetical protein